MFPEGLKWCLALQFLLPHCFLETRTQEDQSKHLVDAVSGSNVSLRNSSLPENFERLTWFYTATQKILEWESKKPSAHYYTNKFKGRVGLNFQDGALHIYNVQREDQSTYILKVLKSGIEDEWSIQLRVFDPVPKPAIKIEKTQEVNNTCYLILSCAVDRMFQNQSVTYTWSGDSGRIPEQLQGDVLKITVQPQNFSRFYTCEVSNPVSNNNDTVYFTPTCNVVPSSGVAWIPAWLTVVVPTILSLLLI